MDDAASEKLSELSRNHGLPLAQAQPGGVALEVPDASAAALPAVLNRGRVADYVQQFSAEYGPVGPVELAIVRDLAVQASQMEFWEEALEAVARSRAILLPEVASHGNEFAVSTLDVSLAAAVSAPEVESIDRSLRSHTAAFYRAMQTLEEKQSRRTKSNDGVVCRILRRVSTEAACEEHLANRVKDGHFICPSCGGRKCYLVISRKSVECRQCRRQSGLRSGTVAAESPLALTIWFRAIVFLLYDPTISTADLAQRLDIRRLATVRAMAAKIRDAIASPNASQQLAGLDELAAEFMGGLPEPSVPSEQQFSTVAVLDSRVPELNLTSTESTTYVLEIQATAGCPCP